MDILREAKRVFSVQIDSLKETMNSIDDNFINLVEMIQKSQGRIIVTGMGKSGHVARKISATMSSLGTTSYFLHPGEGLHGDLGGIKKNDIVIALSKSGESDEVIGLIPSIKHIGAKIVSVTCKEKSTLSQSADIQIYLKITEEASNYKLAPTSSTTAMIVFGDALAVTLEKLNNFQPKDFAIFHPNGLLGKRLLLRVETIMAKDDFNPVVSLNANLKKTILVMSSKGLGGVTVVSKENKLVGLLTDGDLRRLIEKNNTNLLDILVKDVMTKNPIFINMNEKAYDAVSLLKNIKRPISLLPVVNENNVVVGMLRLDHIFKAGLL